MPAPWSIYPPSRFPTRPCVQSLVRNVQYKPITQEVIDYTADQLAKVRMSEESTGGMAAVQAGKKPPWALSPMPFPPA